MKSKQRPAARTGSKGSDVLTNDERDAIREYVRERKAGARRTGNEDLEGEVLAKIAEMSPTDRAIAERLHALIKSTAPGLTPRTWYGMPAYAKEGNVLCFFQPAQKFKTRYATFGFSDKANLDDGNMWPNSYALKKLTTADESKIRTLVKRAVS
jgi:uncharacterized protein YdhG (YjbR/CyaY superfamily)